MAETRRKAGSAFFVFLKNRISKWIKSKYSISIVLLIIIVFLFVALVLIWRYAAKNSGEIEFWNYVGDSQIEIWGLVGVCIPIVSGILAKKYEKKCIYVMVNTFLIFCVIFFVSFDLGAFAKVRAEVLKVEQNKSSNEEKNSGISEPDTIIIIPYDVDLDPFMENHSLEEYYGEVVLEENIQETMVKVLLNNLDNNRPEGEKNEDYTEYQELADAEYDTYYYELRRDKENDREELFNNRIRRLQQSLDNRILADGICEMPDNERPIATGYKDKGDEYAKRSKHNEALSAYELSAEWYMRAICHAAAIKDSEEVVLCLKKYKELETAVTKLDQISDEREQRIVNMVKIYNIFVNSMVNN